MPDFIWTDSQWSPDTLQRTWDEITKINREELKIKTYPTQIEIISSEQMLDYYSSHALPVMYRHWSFGKHFVKHQEQYKLGHVGLAYEIVQNTNPNIAYCMEDNSSTMQALVMAHAGVGHNGFFCNNYFFREQTDAEAIADYMVFARNFIAKAEDRYGLETVSGFLDACHALQWNGISRYRRPPKLRKDLQEEKLKQRQAYLDSRISEMDMVSIWKKENKDDNEDEIAEKLVKQPEENILYFCEKNGDIKPWQREVIRIVRKLSQYFYPNLMTSVGNEGFACIVHFKIMTRLHEKGLISDGSYLEFLHSHTGVLTQLGATNKHYNGINVYKLGYEIYKDIERICTDPTEEDKNWFPFLIGKDPWESIMDAVINYRDESFIRQFLSPKVMRDMRMFHITDDRNKPVYEVKSIHDEKGYKEIRNRLADMHEWDYKFPTIEIVNVEKTNRKLILEHSDSRGRKLDNKNRPYMVNHLEKLWGGPIELTEKA